MYYTSEHHPDCRVFVKRLITPKKSVTINRAINFDGTITASGTHISDAAMNAAFGDYSPKIFYRDLVNYYRIAYNADIAELNKSIVAFNKQIDANNKIIKTASKTSKEYSDAQANNAYLEVEIEDMQMSLTTMRATYEPILLEIAIGVYSAQTTVLRSGIGSASVTIKLPIDDNGFNEDILHAFQNDEMWNLDQQFRGGTSQSTPISPKQLNIFKIIDGKVDRRECSLLPHDMMQVWFPRRYSNTTQMNSKKNTVGIPKFPQDYTPGFVGFIKSTSVNFTGGQTPSYTISINCEDSGLPLRMSRVNLDPALDPKYRLGSLSLTMGTTKLSAPDVPFMYPSEYIKSLVVGQTGYWKGVSQIEVQDDLEFDETTQQHVSKTNKDAKEANAVRDTSTYRKVSLVGMPWEFDHMKLDLHDDLITKEWRPYVISFKNAFKLWESDYKYRWDICKEISDVMEFEFYVDNFGVIHYHPPFYNWNPANAKYFIEDKEILSEDHKFDETGVVTSVEIVSQPQILTMENIDRFLSGIARAPDDIIQRYGLRFKSKNIPALSGTDIGAQGGILTENTRDARHLYARAWINRRNYELKSATVDIPGTPELHLCNTVAFVGSLSDVTKNIALSSTHGEIGGIKGYEKSNIQVGVNNMPSGNSIVNNMPVYYISGISHKYTQGGSFTTTLTLTHGRRWGDPYSIGSVGYSFSENDHDELIKAMKIYWGQPAEAAEQVRLAASLGFKMKNVPTIMDSFSVNSKPMLTLKNPNLAYTDPLGLTKTGSGYLK